MHDSSDIEKLPLPKGWPDVAKSAILHAVSLASTAFKIAIGRQLDSPIPIARDEAQRQRDRTESNLYLVWYSQFRPHQTLNGRTPDEVFFLVGSTTLSRPLGDREPANEKPRWEPRKNWPRKAVCGAPWAEVKGRRGAKAELRLSLLEGRKHLPVVELTWAA